MQADPEQALHPSITAYQKDPPLQSSWATTAKMQSTKLSMMLAAVSASCGLSPCPSKSIPQQWKWCTRRSACNVVSSPLVHHQCTVSAELMTAHASLCMLADPQRLIPHLALRPDGDTTSGQVCQMLNRRKRSLLICSTAHESHWQGQRAMLDQCLLDRAL